MRRNIDRKAVINRFALINIIYPFLHNNNICFERFISIFCTNNINVCRRDISDNNPYIVIKARFFIW